MILKLCIQIFLILTINSKRDLSNSQDLIFPTKELNHSIHLHYKKKKLKLKMNTKKQKTNSKIYFTEIWTFLLRLVRNSKSFRAAMVTILLFLIKKVQINQKNIFILIFYEK